ncbi:transposase domain-containing protein [Kitasatospora aureofaciens]|uniref:transposase domain-containing protein n=1 Tax=Kitasatospora aureofaciens TaxID=1894 RepID=UPI0027E0BCB9|nr:transposase domain-containing protein [Kitasatospora aureofaciens]
MCTPEVVDAVIAEHGRAERRRRILPARLVVYFVLAPKAEVGRWHGSKKPRVGPHRRFQSARLRPGH